MHDLLQMSNVGVNWAVQLRDYQRILNDDSMELFNYRSPFEVFYRRKSNAVTQRNLGGLFCKEDTSKQRPTIFPNSNDIKSNDKNVARVRSEAKSASRVWDKRYINRRMKNHPPSEYLVEKKKELIRRSEARRVGKECRSRWSPDR